MASLSSFHQPVGPPDADGWHPLTRDGAPLARAGGRIHCKVDGRFVSVIRGPTSGRLYCMDAVCYHMGGPLTVGDIEEVNGQLCVKCPWHHYSVTLETGAKLYQAMDFDPRTKKLVPAGWKASERRQRVHEVEERGASGAVWVRLTSHDRSAKRHDEAESLDYGSDKWAYNAGAAGNVCRPGMSSGGDGRSVRKMRSGDGQHPSGRRSGYGGGGGRGGGGRGGSSSFSSSSSSSSSSSLTAPGRAPYQRSGAVLAHAREAAKGNRAAGMMHNNNTKRRAARIAGGAGAAALSSTLSSSSSSMRLDEADEEESSDEEMGRGGQGEGKRTGGPSGVPHGPAMEPTRWTGYTLVGRQRVAGSMWLFRFALPHPKMRLGWESVERHLRVRAMVRGQEVVREYTPVSDTLRQTGSFDLAIKVYQQGGLMSRHIADMRVGASLEMCGPFGETTLLRTSPRGTLSVQGERGAPPQAATRLSMIAAGSGITPMLQILRRVSAERGSAALPPVGLLYANQTAADVAFGPEIEGLAQVWGSAFEWVHVLSRERGGGGDDGGGGGGGGGGHGGGGEGKAAPSRVHYGRIDVGVLEAHVGTAQDDGHFCFVCGSPEFEAAMRTLLAEALGHAEDHVLTF